MEECVFVTMKDCGGSYLKTECMYWHDFATRQEALQAIHAWIEHDYNVSRAHSGVSYATPAEHEQQFALASSTAKK